MALEDPMTAKTLATPQGLATAMGATQVAATTPDALPGGGPLSPTLVPRPTCLPPDDNETAKAHAHRFEPLRRLGAGGMGEVALVRDHDIGRTVALKRPLGALDEASLQRFAREVRTVGKLEHPGITPIHDVGVDEDGRHYFVMKYVEGETLEHVLGKLAAGDPAYTTRYTFEYRAQIFQQLLYAVKYAHARGVIHRDIKPANVMIGPFGEVMLMDWGIAREFGGGRTEEPHARAADSVSPLYATLDGEIIGSPAYMSPEQGRGELAKLGPRSDVYSLCVLFHEMLTLKHYLHDKPTATALLASVIDEEEVTDQLLASGVAAGAPIEYVHFVRRGLRKRIEDRFADVDAMLAELASIRDNVVPIRCHVSFMKRALGWANNRLNAHPHLGFAIWVLAASALAFGIYSGVAAIVGLFAGG